MVAVSEAVPLDDREIRANGTPEAAWRRWLQAQTFAQAEVATLLGDAERLVVVAPHPDDEILGCGGLLALQLARGGQALVIGLTDGEHSHSAAAGFDSGALAVQRAAERLEDARRLGVDGDDVVSLHLPDAALAAHADAMVAKLEPLLRPTDRVVSTWRLDGHPDHDACGAAAARACAAAGCGHLEALVWMWNWAHPGDARVPWHRIVRLPLSPQAQSIKQHALAAHASQLNARSAEIGPVLGDDIRAGAERPHEYFLK